MVAVLSIWNLALSHLGDKAGLSSASAPYASRNAELCGMYWPLARQLAISKTKPSWSRKRITLALVDLGEYQPSQWAYTYTKPADALKVTGIYAADGGYDEDSKTAVFEEASEASVIYTNVETAVGRYICDVEDSSKYHPEFATGVSWLLAAYLAGPIVKGSEGMKLAEAFEKKAWAYFGLSETEDANQSQRRDVFSDDSMRPPWIQARGFAETLIGESNIFRFGSE